MSSKNILLPDKLEILRKEFAEIDLNHDDILTQSEFLKFLDLKLGREFDRNVALQLYERMDKDNNGNVTVEEFIKTLLDAEEILKNKIENSKHFLEEYGQEKTKAYQKLGRFVLIMVLEEIRQIEHTNSFGIMENSNLNLTVLEGQSFGTEFGLKTHGEYYCVVSCAEFKFQTKVSSGGSPIWNESFSFPIENGMEILHIIVKDYSEYPNEDFLGQLYIPVNTLRDQNKHEDWLDLYDKNGNLSQGKLHLALQWIHSKVKYLTDVIKKWQHYIELQEEDLAEYERDLAILYEPFNGLMQLYLNQNKEPKDLTSIGNVPSSNYNYTFPKSQLLQQNSTQKDTFLKTIDTNSIDFYPKLFNCCYIIITIFTCFNRPAFIDPWWNNKDIIKIELGVKRFVLSFSYLLLILKVGLIVIFMKFYYDGKAKENPKETNSLENKNKKNNR